jgi:nitroreductase
MKVSEALEQRKSVRAFVDTPVDNKLIRALLEKSARAASGGNLQPWRIFIINNEAMKAFLKHLSEWDKPETPAYDVYPEGLTEPYHLFQFQEDHTCPLQLFILKIYKAQLIPQDKHHKPGFRTYPIPTSALEKLSLLHY